MLLVSRVTFSVPPTCPRSILERPGPCPAPMGARLRRSGSANVVWPLPPYVVPSNENRAVFWAMGRICPLQSAQPRGAKLPAKMAMDARNGSELIEFVSFEDSVVAIDTEPAH